ncbi:MAG: hypothetical protein HY908_10995 [Myxococcales bacterium]|nr:hypothetical protein [Myxococcales bacterium]
MLLGTGDALAARHPPLAGVERFGVVPPRRDGRGCSVVDRSVPRAPGDFAGDTQRWTELHAGGVTYVAEGGRLRAALATLRFRLLAGRPEPVSTYANEAWHPAPYPAGEPAEQLRILEEALAACAG